MYSQTHSIQRHTLHPTPYSLHPTPYTLHPTPYALLSLPSVPPSLYPPLPKKPDTLHGALFRNKHEIGSTLPATNTKQIYSGDERIMEDCSDFLSTSSFASFQEVFVSTGRKLSVFVSLRQKTFCFFAPFQEVSVFLRQKAFCGSSCRSVFQLKPAY
jgi:hypothetical protein